jgi:exopolysaccharide production protein ExoQ
VWTPYYTGVTTDKNALGMICFIFGLGSVWRVSQELRSGKVSRISGPLISHGIVLATVFWLLAKASSMTSLSCFVLASGLIVATSFPRLVRRRGVVHLLVAAVLLVTFSTLFLDIGSGVLDAMGRNPTLTGRTDIWQLVLHMNVNPLIGAGFESFWLGPRLEKIWDVYWFHPTEAHNGYIDIFLNLGWLGVIFLLAVIVAGYRHVIGMLRRDPEAGRLKLALFVAAVAYNFTESAFKAMHLVWIAFLLAAIAAPDGRLRFKAKKAISTDDYRAEAVPDLEGVGSPALRSAGADPGEPARLAIRNNPSMEWN